MRIGKRGAARNWRECHSNSSGSLSSSQLGFHRNGDLTLDGVMEFQNNCYAIGNEKSPGIGAFEVLVNKWTGAVTPEPGPNTMWNTKYGMMGYTVPTGRMTVTAD